MGLDADGLRLLCALKQYGASFKRVMMLGRQWCFITPPALRNLLGEYGLANPSGLAPLTYAEPLFEVLGAEMIDSLDASAFEGCTVVHDLNKPVGDHLLGLYDLVFDGGLLEHVYNFPVAMESAMKMVAPGGWLVSVVPCNNECGHGLYQFSPELYFRVLSPRNGFVVREMLLCERRPRQSRWYRVMDPALLGSRICLRNAYPVYLLCAASRSVGACLTKSAPQQSDYEASWRNDEPNTKPTAVTGRTSIRKSVQHKIQQWFPSLYEMLIRGYHNRWICSFHNRRVYAPVGQAGYRINARGS